MRTGYIIKDRSRRGRGWFARRLRQEDQHGKAAPVNVYAPTPEDAWQWHRLKDARRFLALLRRESKHPSAIVIIDPKWRIMT